LHLKSAGLVALGAALAGAGFVAWQHFFSREAEVRAIHRACLDEIASERARLEERIERSTGGFEPDSTAGSIAKGIREGLGRMLDGVSGGMGDAVCSTIRDSCSSDFEGRICTAARERYR
jgi:hypothetical protein